MGEAVRVNQFAIRGRAIERGEPPAEQKAAEQAADVREIIDILHEKADAEVDADDEEQPEQGRNAAAIERPAMDEYEDAVRPHQPEDGPGRADTDLLRHEGETGDDADYSGHKIDEQEAQVTHQPLDKDAQHDEVEHVQTDVQQVGMQKDGRDEAPVLALKHSLIVLRAIGDQHICQRVVVLNVDCVCQHVQQHRVQPVRSRCQRVLVSGETPDGDGNEGDDPGDPGDARDAAERAIPVQGRSVADAHAYGPAYSVIARVALFQSHLNALTKPAIFAAITNLIMYTFKPGEGHNQKAHDMGPGTGLIPNVACG